jgi:hypothetical protein
MNRITTRVSSCLSYHPVRIGLAYWQERKTLGFNRIRRMYRMKALAVSCALQPSCQDGLEPILSILFILLGLRWRIGKKEKL